MTFELLRNAELYDPSPRGRVDLLIAGGRILWIGRDGPPIPHPYDVRETDLGGRRIIPRLVDGHVHLTGGGGEAGPHTRVPPQQLNASTEEISASASHLADAAERLLAATGRFTLEAVSAAPAAAAPAAAA